MKNNCPCIESIKTFLATGKWDGGCSRMGKGLPLGHLLIAGAVGLVLSVLLGALISRSRRD